MLKAFDTFQYLCFTFPNLLEIIFNHIYPSFEFEVFWYASICCICQKIWGKLQKSLTSLFIKMFCWKKNFLKCFVAIQFSIQGFGESIHFLIRSSLVEVPSSIWNYPVGTSISLWLLLPQFVCVWVWGIINYSFAEVYLALQYRAIYHRNKCWENITITTALPSAPSF